jgi:hypothetical protein
VLFLLLAAQVELAPPPGADLTKPFRIVRISDGAEIPVQAAGASLVLGPTSGEHRLEAVAPKDGPEVEVVDVDGKRLDFSAGGKRVVRYHYGHVDPPAGVKPEFGRSGYLHPVWDPAGRVVTNDVPPNHLHHHGIWFPWTSSEFEGRKTDFWNSGAKQGKVECVKVEGSGSGPVFGWLRARQRHVALTGPAGPKAALDEIWELRVYAPVGRHVFDLTSTQTCATDAPLVIRKYHYGGLGLRGSGAWEGKEGVAFLTSEGKTRKDGNETAGRWVVMSGPIDGRPSSIGILCHPSNFRAPQPMRLHPSEPFFCYAPSQGGDFSIEPGKPYVSRYRFVIADGVLDAEEMERRWKDWTGPGDVRVK